MVVSYWFNDWEDGEETNIPVCAPVVLETRERGREANPTGVNCCCCC